jgi:hypothetical protein
VEREERAHAVDYGGLFVVRRDDHRDGRSVVRGEELGEAGEDLAPDIVGDLGKGDSVQDEVYAVDDQEVGQHEVVDGEYEVVKTHVPPP